MTLQIMLTEDAPEVIRALVPSNNSWCGFFPMAEGTGTRYSLFRSKLLQMGALNFIDIKVVLETGQPEVALFLAYGV